MKLLDLGTKVFMKGFYVEGKGKGTVVLIPQNKEPKSIDFMSTTEDSYKTIVKQLDVQEAECFDYHHGTRHIVRRTQRNLDQRVSWKVYKRDNYTCRYCGIDGVPMSYDHIFLWELGGDNTVENGVCACKNCNQRRGNTDYTDWIEGPYYAAMKHNLSPEVIQANDDLKFVYKTFSPRISKRKR